MTERRERGWLPEGGNPPRRGVLEDTLFRRLEEMRKKPPGELFELLERTLEVLRATKEALLEQRREIRSLATAVDTLRRRVDQLVQPRPDYAHPQPEPEPEPERDPQPAPDAEQVLEPVIEPGFDPAVEPEPEDEPEPEPDLLPAAGPSVELPPVDQSRFEPAEVDHVVVEIPAEAISEPAPEATFEPTPEPVFEAAAEHVLMLSTAAGYRILIGDGAEPGSSDRRRRSRLPGRGPYELALPRRHPDRLLRHPLGLDSLGLDSLGLHSLGLHRAARERRTARLLLEAGGV